ncbi:unnamed protein product, partial [Effrenium voratum]
RAHEAAEQGDVSALQAMSNEELQESFRGARPLHVAAAHNQLRAMDVLISRGAQLEELDLLGRTPLIHATVFRAAEAVVWLAHKGAKLAHADQDGRTALHWAVRSSAPLTALLATVGAPLDVLDLEGCSPLGTAVELERLEVVEQLVLSGRADRVMREAALARLRPGPCSSWLRRCLEQQVGCHAALQEHCFLSCQAFPESRGCRGPEQIQAEPREFCWACAVLALGSAVFMLAKNDGSVREIDGPSQLLCAMVVPLTWAGALCFLAGARLPPGSVPATEARARRYKHVLQHAAAVKADDPDPGDFNWWGTKAQVVHELEMLGPERSKFCTATRQCVPMFDHYCAFLRNSVGPGSGLRVNRSTDLSASAHQPLPSSLRVLLRNGTGTGWFQWCKECLLLERAMLSAC